MAKQLLFPLPSTIVFDIGNVLVTTDLERFFAHLRKLLPEDAAFTKALKWLDKADDPYELGLMTTQELLEEVHAELGISREHFIDLWNYLFVERSYIPSFLKELREQGYTLAVCSNTNEIHVEVTEQPSCEHLFIDDLIENVQGAHAVGWDAIHFQDPEQVQEELFARGLQFTPWRFE